MPPRLMEGIRNLSSTLRFLVRWTLVYASASHLSGQPIVRKNHKRTLLPEIFTVCWAPFCGIPSTERSFLTNRVITPFYPEYWASPLTLLSLRDPLILPVTHAPPGASAGFKTTPFGFEYLNRYKSLDIPRKPPSTLDAESLLPE